MPYSYLPLAGGGGGGLITLPAFGDGRPPIGCRGVTGPDGFLFTAFHLPILVAPGAA
jgi:hypothetical protein